MARLARSQGMVREIRAARDLNADIDNPMSQLEMKLSEGFDILKDCDGYLEHLAGNLSKCEAQVLYACQESLLNSVKRAR